jgi:hypothetical protein
MSDCECMDRGIPRGMVCGKPSCPQTEDATQTVRVILDLLAYERLEAPPSGQRLMHEIDDAKRAGTAPKDSAG